MISNIKLTQKLLNPKGLAALVILGVGLSLTPASVMAQSSEFRTTKASACYPNEGNAEAAYKGAVNFAREKAIGQAGSYIVANTSVKDFVIEDQHMATLSAGTLLNVQIVESENQMADAVCVDLVAEYDPNEVIAQVKSILERIEIDRLRYAFVSQTDTDKCSSEIQHDNVLRAPLKSRDDALNVRKQLTDLATEEALKQSRWTLMRSSSVVEISDDGSDLNQRFYQRMASRTAGFARVKALQEKIIEGKNGEVLKMEFVSLVCIPKNPLIMPVPVFVKAVITTRGEDNAELKDIISEGLIKNEYISLAMNEKDAEIIVEGKILNIDVQLVDVKKGDAGRMKPGKYNRIMVSVSATGKDYLTKEKVVRQTNDTNWYPASRDAREATKSLIQRTVAKLGVELANEINASYSRSLGEKVKKKEPKKKKVVF